MPKRIPHMPPVPFLRPFLRSADRGGSPQNADDIARHEAGEEAFYLSARAGLELHLKTASMPLKIGEAAVWQPVNNHPLFPANFAPKLRQDEFVLHATYPAMTTFPQSRR